MRGFAGFIDPPGPFAPRSEWATYLAELRELDPSDQVKEAIVEAEEGLKLAPVDVENADVDEEDVDDISDLDDDE